MNEKLLDRLLLHDQTMKEWLAQSDENQCAFKENPLGVFQQVTNESNELIAEIEEYRSKWQPESSNFPLVESSAMELQSTKEPVVNSLKLCSNADNISYADYTNGWDMVSAITQTKANEGLSYFFSKKSISFDKSVTVTLIGTAKVDLKGVFGAPQITGGAGSNIDISLPIASGTATINGKTTDIGGVELQFTTSLKGIESTGGLETDKKTYDYFINFTEEDTITNLKINGLKNVSDIEKLIYEGVFKSVVNSAFYEHEYKLFSVDLNIGKTGIESDLLPTYVRYALLEITGAENVLGVLILTTGELDKQTIRIDDNAIPDNSDTAVLMSNRISMDIIKKTIVSKLGIAEDNIEVKQKDSSTPSLLISTKSSFDYKEKIEGYTVKVKGLNLWLKDNVLNMYICFEVEPSKGITVTYKINATYSAEITTDSETKTQTIAFSKKDYSEDKSTNAAWWVWLISVLTAPFAGLVGVISGLIITEIVRGCVQLVSPSLEDQSMLGTIASIDWNHMDILELKSINTLGHIQIGAKLTLKE